MKIFFTTLALLCNLAIQAQDMPTQILNCIQENFALAETNFFKSISTIEKDLINHNIIDGTSNSIFNQFKSVAAIGMIEQHRSVENILL